MSLYRYRLTKKTNIQGAVTLTTVINPQISLVLSDTTIKGLGDSFGINVSVITDQILNEDITVTLTTHASLSTPSHIVIKAGELITSVTITATKLLETQQSISFKIEEVDQGQFDNTEYSITILPIPLITVTGNFVERIAYGSEDYVDQGATATDNGNDISNNIEVSGDTVNVNNVQAYQIKYDVNLENRNPAVQQIRIVQVYPTVKANHSLLTVNQGISVQEETQSWSYDLNELLSDGIGDGTWTFDGEHDGLNINDGNKLVLTGSTDFEDVNAIKNRTVNVISTVNGVKSDPMNITVNIVNENESPTFGTTEYTFTDGMQQGVAKNIITIEAASDPEGDPVYYTIHSAVDDNGNNFASAFEMNANVLKYTGVLLDNNPSKITVTVRADQDVTYLVTVNTKTSSHPQQSGSTLAFYINDVEAPSLNLKPYSKYIFDQSDASNINVLTTLIEWDTDNALNNSTWESTESGHIKRLGSGWVGIYSLSTFTHAQITNSPIQWQITTYTTHHGQFMIGLISTTSNWIGGFGGKAHPDFYHKEGEIITWGGNSNFSENITINDVFGLQLTTDTPPQVQFLLNGVVVNTENITAADEYRLAISSYKSTEIVSSQIVSSELAHPLRFYTDEAKTESYTTGITVNDNITTFIVPADAPATLYYQCENHALMGGSASIVEVDDNKATVVIDTFTN